MKRRGFTLIEVLVVIAIILALAAILLPVLGTARGMARRVGCAAHLKQFGAAFSMYLQDWDEVYPSPGGRPYYGHCWDQGPGGVEPYIKNRGMKLASIWCCPEWKGPHEAQYEPRTYGMNSMLRNPPDIEPYYVAIFAWRTLPASQVVVPAQTILLYEGIPDMIQGWVGYVGRCGDWTQVRGYDRKPDPAKWRSDEPWHGKQNNYLFCDGHVKAMAPEKERPTPENNLWFVRRWRE